MQEQLEFSDKVKKMTMDELEKMSETRAHLSPDKYPILDREIQDRKDRQKLEIEQDENLLHKEGNKLAKYALVVSIIALIISILVAFLK